MNQPNVKSVIPSTWKVPELFRSRLGESAGRQRAMVSDGHLLIVLHEPPMPGDHMRRGRLFWREPDGQWKSNSLRTGIQALKKHLAEYSDAAAQLADRLDLAESADDYFSILQAAAPLSRAARHSHAALQQARELTPDDREMVSLRDQAGEIERAAELIHSDAENGLDFTVARRSEEQAQRSYEMAIAAHRLNLLAAIFFPIATLSAIFGMNLEHGLGIRENPVAFWAVLLIGFVGGVLLTGIITSKSPQRMRRSATEPAAKPKRSSESRRAEDGS